MITRDYAVTMAAYNRWQNDNLYGAASGLSDEERTRDRGAFFGSIHATLGHVLWADAIWMHRLAGRAPVGGCARDGHDVDWEGLCQARRHMDDDIEAWAKALDPVWLDGHLTWYSGANQRELSRARGLLVAHMFNHQTHHRGQAHAMVTAAGARPGDTDLAFMGL